MTLDIIRRPENCPLRCFTSCRTERVTYDVFAALDDVPLLHEQVEHSRRARGAPEQKKPWTKAFGTLGQNNSRMLFTKAGCVRYRCNGHGVKFTWGRYDTMRPKQMKVERAVVNQS